MMNFSGFAGYICRWTFVFVIDLILCLWAFNEYLLNLINLCRTKMSTRTSTEPGSKLLTNDQKKELYLQQISTLLEESNMVIKRLPPGSCTLMKAISNCFNYTHIFYEQIQQAIINHLKNLIAANKLPPRLNMFQGNNMLWKDFSSNPNLPGFEKINLELISSFFKVKVILYFVLDDQYLSTIIFNNKYKSQIKLIRAPGNNYHPVYPLDTYNRLGFCQNIVLNLINLAVEGKAHFQNLNNEKYLNYEYEEYLSSQKTSNPEIQISRPKHKKSLSDGLEKILGDPDSPDLKFYNMFMNMKPLQDMIKVVQPERKDTADSNLARNANLDFIEDGWISPNRKDFGIKNYPVITSSSNGSLNQIPEVRIREGTGQAKGSNIFFNENLSISEIERMEKAPQRDLNSVSPIYYINTPPPGLTPSRYPQKSTPITSEPIITTPTQQEYIPSPYQPRDNSMGNMQMGGMGMGYGYSPDKSGGYQYGGNNYNNNLYSKRTGNSKNLSLATSNEDVSDGGLKSGASTVEKKKPIILEESMQRYTGRLKFFDENKNYGFIVMDDDGSDIFVHYDDLSKANLGKELLKSARMGNIIRLSFSCMKYVGKYDKSRKATDIIMLAEAEESQDS